MLERLGGALKRVGDEIALRHEVPFSPGHLRATGRWALLAVPILKGDQALSEALREGHGLSGIVRALRPQPLEVQQSFLAAALDKAGFPNHQPLAEFLAQINDPAFPWFAPTQEPNPGQLQGLVDQHLAALNLPPSPLNLIRTDWNAAGAAAWDAAGGAAGAAAWAAAGAAAWNAAWDAARAAAWNAAWAAAGAAAWAAAGAAAGAAAWAAAGGAAGDAARDAARAAMWIVVQDLMPERGYRHGNPFSPLMNIYEQGLWPIGLAAGEFNIFIPPLKKAA